MLRERYVKRSDIAERLNLPERTIRETIEPRPDFPKPALRFSRKTVLWLESDIDAFIRDMRQRSA